MTTHQTPLYTEIEHTILSNYLGVPTLATAESVDPLCFLDQQDTGGITLTSTEYGDQESYMESNAVARIGLHAIQTRLRAFLSWDENGSCFARTHDPKRHSKLAIKPQHLLEINWADSGPGFSWPEQYNLCFLPLYDLYIVTGSQDSPDVYGYCDVTIGHFEAPVSELKAKAASFIQKWWKGQAENGQDRWQEVWCTGLFTEADAEAWADKIWEDPYT